MSARIQLSNVGQRFLVKGNDDQRIREFVALEGLDLDVPAGEILTVVGPSGCGKSTIIDLVAGLATPAEGSVL
ncbi:MAG TPA: ATP-binding cassette domain-containing protein, partial [Nocardioides sp.]|nr:ATP-binding cassette domain-containing protein [Nocardioides sp.]